MDYYSAYSQMDTNSLRNFAMNESKDLNSEALSQLIQALKDRSFDQTIIDNVKTNQLKYSDENILKTSIEYMKNICPLCNNEYGINALRIDELYSVIIFTKFSSRIVIGCNSCLKDEILRSNIYSLVLGPWGFPVGIIGTPIVIIGNLLKLNYLRRDMPTKDLLQYIRNNIE